MTRIVGRTKHIKPSGQVRARLTPHAAAGKKGGRKAVDRSYGDQRGPQLERIIAGWIARLRDAPKLRGGNMSAVTYGAQRLAQRAAKGL
ncbi:unnamed protein product [Boreogadus saida]